MPSSRIKSLQDFSPLLFFVIIFFLLNLFEIGMATTFIFASVAAVLVFMVEIKLLKDDFQILRENNKRLNFFSGLLSLMLLIVFFNGFLHWRKMISLNYRTALLFFLLLVFMVIMFRAMHVFAEIKEKSTKKKKR